MLDKNASSRTVPIKKIILLVILAGVLLLSIEKGMQLLAMLVVAIFSAIYYHFHASLLFEKVLSMVGKARTARFGEFEVSLEQSSIDDLYPNSPAWFRAIMNQLSADHIGLLMQIGRKERFAISKPLLARLRDLRIRGLIIHDKERLQDSNIAELTELGKLFVNQLIDEFQEPLAELEEKLGSQLSDTK
jgi:hypothetical protein